MNESVAKVILCDRWILYSPFSLSQHWLFRSSGTEVFLEKGVLKICSKLTENHLCRSAISVKFQIKITFRHDFSRGSSPVNLPHIFRIPFLKNTPRWLLLAFDSTILHGNNALSFRVLWTKKRYASFLRKVLVFQKNLFQS